MKRILVFALTCLTANLFAQTLSLSNLPKPAKQLLEDYVRIPGGTFTMNLRDGFDSLQFQGINRATVSSVYMSRFEVTVSEYRRFFQESGDVQNKYDTAVWTRDFPYSYNAPMAKNYTNHPAFDEYPIVGITWEQAVRYCQWKTEQVNKLLENTDYKVEIRLPTDAEWQFAALGIMNSQTKNELITDRRIFPWSGGFLWSTNGKNCLQTNCNSGVTRTPQDYLLLSFASDGGLYTMPVESFKPNEYGLYQMAGNVAEWTSDNYAVDTTHFEQARQIFADGPTTLSRFIPSFPLDKYSDYKIVKGGSWADEPFYMQIGVLQIQHPKHASATVGFRPVLRIFRD